MQKYMSDWLLSAAFQWLRSLAGDIIGSMGWGHVVALVAGGILLLSLSAKAMKFVASPGGMAACVLLVAAGLYFGMGGSNATAPASLVEEPEEAGPVLASRSEPQEDEPLEAVVEEPAPVAPLASTVATPLLPMMGAMIAPAVIGTNSQGMSHPSEHSHAGEASHHAVHHAVAAAPAPHAAVPAHSPATSHHEMQNGGGTTSKSAGSTTRAHASTGDDAVTRANAELGGSRAAALSMERMASARRRSASGGGSRTAMQSGGYGGGGFPVTGQANHLSPAQARRQAIHRSNVIAGRQIDAMLGGYVGGAVMGGGMAGHGGMHHGGMGHHSGHMGHMGGHH